MISANYLRTESVIVKLVVIQYQSFGSTPHLYCCYEICLYCIAHAQFEWFLITDNLNAE